MENYSVLVSKVLSNKLLVDAIEDIANEEDCLNLVTNDWEERLEKNVIYHNCTISNLKKFSNCKISNFTVVIVSYCKFKSDNLIICNSEPLIKMTRAMTANLESHIQLSNDFEFNFIDCNVFLCSTCRNSTERLAILSKEIITFQPCIEDTKLYNGKDVFHYFHSKIKKIFSSMFLAILRLKIKVRRNQKVYSIDGKILNFIGFNEQALTLKEAGRFENFAWTQTPAPEKGVCVSTQTPNFGENNSLLCGICVREEKQIFFENCGHVFCCASCAKELKDCPICRKYIGRRVRLYFS